MTITPSIIALFVLIIPSVCLSFWLPLRCVCPSDYPLGLSVLLIIPSVCLSFWLSPRFVYPDYPLGLSVLIIPSVCLSFWLSSRFVYPDYPFGMSVLIIPSVCLCWLSPRFVCPDYPLGLSVLLIIPSVCLSFWLSPRYLQTFMHYRVQICSISCSFIQCSTSRIHYQDGIHFRCSLI